jgi:hypothetical protein
VALQAVERWVVNRRAEWESRLDRLGDYLQRERNPHEQNGHEQNEHEHNEEESSK